MSSVLDKPSAGNKVQPELPFDPASQGQQYMLPHSSREIYMIYRDQGTNVVEPLQQKGVKTMDDATTYLRHDGPISAILFPAKDDDHALAIALKWGGENWEEQEISEGYTSLTYDYVPLVTDNNPAEAFSDLNAL